MKYYIILFAIIFNLQNAICQTKQHYSNKEREYVERSEYRKEYVQKSENYYNSQKLKCDDLMTFVTENGTKTDYVHQVSLLTSKWLNEVEYYKVENNYVVVAEFKKMGRLGYEYKKYIFCGISKANWDNFKNGYNDLMTTHGERFHKYIYDYKCDCQ